MATIIWVSPASPTPSLLKIIARQPTWSCRAADASLDGNGDREDGAVRGRPILPREPEGRATPEAPREGIGYHAIIPLAAGLRLIDQVAAVDHVQGLRTRCTSSGGLSNRRQRCRAISPDCAPSPPPLASAASDLSLFK